MSTSRSNLELKYYVPDTPDQDSHSGSDSGGLNSKWRTWWRSGRKHQEAVSTGNCGGVLQELDEGWWSRRSLFQDPAGDNSFQHFSEAAEVVRNLNNHFENSGTPGARGILDEQAENSDGSTSPIFRGAGCEWQQEATTREGGVSETPGLLPNLIDRTAQWLAKNRKPRVHFAGVADPVSEKFAFTSGDENSVFPVTVKKPTVMAGGADGLDPPDRRRQSNRFSADRPNVAEQFFSSPDLNADQTAEHAEHNCVRAEAFSRVMAMPLVQELLDTQWKILMGETTEPPEVQAREKGSEPPGEERRKDKQTAQPEETSSGQGSQ